MLPPRVPILVAASVSEWSDYRSLTLAATATQPKHASADRTQCEMKCLPPLILAWVLLYSGLAVPARAASKDKGLDVLISADAIPSPEGFRPKPGRPIHYLYFQSHQTLGEPVAGVKLPEPAVVEKAIVAELEKQGFVRAAEGGPLPEIAIIASVGDANFEEPPIQWDNPYLDPEFATYLDMVDVRKILEPYFLSQKVPKTAAEIFDPNRANSGDIAQARDLLVSDAMRLRENGSPRAQDRGKILALVGAKKIDRAVADRSVSSSAAERVARATRENLLYVTLNAFEAKRQANGSRNFLWRTTMFIDWRNDFAKSLTAMLEQAGPMFGTDVAVPGFVNTAKPREGKVEIGEAKVVPEKSSANEPAAPAAKK